MHCRQGRGSRGEAEAVELRQSGAQRESGMAGHHFRGRTARSGVINRASPPRPPLANQEAMHRTARTAGELPPLWTKSTMHRFPAHGERPRHCHGLSSSSRQSCLCRADVLTENIASPPVPEPCTAHHLGDGLLCPRGRSRVQNAPFPPLLVYVFSNEAVK